MTQPLQTSVALEPFASVDPKPPSSDAAKLPLVLVVDDSRMQRKIVVSALKKWGYRVIEAGGGQEALGICQTQDVQLIISDWMMPGMDGTDFCKAFRALDRSDYGYFILLTSKGETSEVAHGLDAGADDFLTKPVSFAELRARLRAGERIVEMQAQLVEKNAIVSDTLSRLQALHEHIERDLKEAQKLQQSLVKDKLVKCSGGTIAMALKPCGHVGGDLVGQFEITPTQIGLFSLDVSGHGVTSALMTARLAGYLSSSTPEQNISIIETPQGFAARPPSQTAALLNDLLLRELETEHYFTMALAIVDLETGHITCVQAGHPHPIIQRASGEVDLIGDGGIPIGLIGGSDYQQFEAQLAPGDRFVLYSDGITECDNMQADFLDEEGLITLLKKHATTPVSELMDDIIWDLQSFSGDRDFADDVSALVFDFTGMPAP